MVVRAAGDGAVQAAVADAGMKRTMAALSAKMQRQLFDSYIHGQMATAAFE
jgi:hypothetical protein